MKSLEERKAERKERAEQAEKDKVVAREVLATGTLAEGAGAKEAKDYSGLSVKELKEELDGREVEYDKGAKKADLIALLEQHDADNAEEEEEEE